MGMWRERMGHHVQGRKRKHEVGKKRHSGPRPGNPILGNTSFPPMTLQASQTSEPKCWVSEANLLFSTKYGPTTTQLPSSKARVGSPFDHAPFLIPTSQTSGSPAYSNPTLPLHHSSPTQAHHHLSPAGPSLRLDPDSPPPKRSYINRVTLFLASHS